ncbi:MAG: hemerythrin domain-containing protein [Myxococcaceae bacterium]
MKLLEELQAEHSLIERVVGSLRTWAEAYTAGNAPAADGAAFLRFFRLYAGDFHHAREEDVLFRALVKESGLPRDQGPIAVITHDHAMMAGLLTELEHLVRARESGGPLSNDHIRDVARRYAHQLWHHIDAENTVLFPECKPRLRAQGVNELSGRGPTDAELSARAEGEALVARWAPMSDHDAYRGEGCIMCPAYGTTCRGLEREWWSESEWEEVHDRLTGM